jgi:methyl-accepting chemotaxis protein
VKQLPIKQWKNVFIGLLNKLRLKLFPRSEQAANKTLDFINNFSIRRRLIFFFLLASLGPILIIGIISYMSSKGAIETKISKYSQKGLAQTAQNLETKLQGIENNSLQFIASPQYNNTLKEYIDAKDLEVYFKSRPVDDLLQAIAFSNSDIYCILFMSASDPTRHELSGTQIPNEFIEKLASSKFYREILNKEGKSVWFPVKLSNDNYMIVMGRKIKSTVTEDPLGVLIIFVNEKSLSNVVNSVNSSAGDQSIQDDYTLIVNSQGVIITSPFKDDLANNITKLLNNPKKIRPLLTNEKDNISFLGKMKNQQVLITGRVISDRGWYILNIAKTAYLYMETKVVGWTTVILGIIFGVIAIFFAIYIAFSISNPLNQVVYSMRQAEKGDFTVRANVIRKDELGYLGISFDHMIEKIGNLLKETKEAIDAVLQHSSVLEESSHQSARAAEAIAAAMEEITKGTMEQTNEAEKSSVKMNDLAKQIEVVVAKASEVEQISGSTRELSLKSKEAVEQLITKTNETDQITEAIIKDIIDLNSSAVEIRGITDIITGIAEQTNLLALNAAIEAARAGNMGLGFAVVAEEVNKLAIQSRDAAKTINNILKTIQLKTEASSKTAEQAHQIIEEQRIAVESAQEAFSEITTATGDIIGRIIFVNYLINNMNSNKQHTVQSITNISAISEQTAASAQEVSASSEEQTALAEQVKMLSHELRKKSEELVEAITKFQV